MSKKKNRVIILFIKKSGETFFVTQPDRVIVDP